MHTKTVQDMLIKQRQTPFGCFIAACAFGAIVTLLLTMTLISYNESVKNLTRIYSTELSINRDAIKIQGAEFKATTASMSTRINYLELKQPSLADTPTAH